MSVDTFRSDSQGDLVRTKPTKAVVGAIYSGIVALLGGLTLALTDGAITSLEWVTIASTTVIAVGGSAGFVYYTPNKPIN